MSRILGGSKRICGCTGAGEVLTVDVFDLQQAERAKIPKKICDTVRRPRIIFPHIELRTCSRG